MNVEVVLQLMPRSITKVSGGRGLGWKLVYRCPPVLRSSYFTNIGEGDGRGVEFPAPSPHPVSVRVVRGRLLKIGDVEESADTDQVPVVSTTANSGQQQSSPVSASSTAVQLTTPTPLPDRQLPQTRHFIGAARPKKVTFSVFRTCPSLFAVIHYWLAVCLDTLVLINAEMVMGWFLQSFGLEWIGLGLVWFCSIFYGWIGLGQMAIYSVINYSSYPPEWSTEAMKLWWTIEVWEVRSLSGPVYYYWETFGFTLLLRKTEPYQVFLALPPPNKCLSRPVCSIFYISYVLNHFQCPF